MIVQADLTVIAPPDIDQALVVELESIAELESSAGALTFRLEPTRVTRAVQAGQQPSDIEGFLAEISSTELPDTVKRLIRDAASKAGTVRVIAAPTVVVVTDPADLTTICAIKALKLNRVTDTVAVTDEPLAKVRTALERKGLVPEAVVGGGVRSARSSSAEAAAAARSAAALRASGNAHANDYLVAHARTLEDQAARLGNLDARLAVTGPLTVTPAVLDALGTTT